MRSVRPALVGILVLASAVVMAVMSPALGATEGPASATLPPPITVTNASPSTVSTAGGTTVTITGSGFVANGVMGVSIGDSDALSFTVVNDTTITATAARGYAGPTDILLYHEGDGGLYEDQFSGLLTYACFPSSDPLTVTSISPSSGPWNDPGRIFIVGTGFDCAPTVTVGGQTVTMDLLVGNSEYYGTLPAVGMNDLGPADVTMSRTLPTSASVTVANAFTYDPPSISEPAIRVVNSQGGPFRVYGGGFTSQSSLLVRGVPVTLSQPPSNFLLTTLPAMTPGPADLTVITPGLPDTTWGGSFNVAAPTAVSCASDNSMEISVQPNAGLLLMAGTGGCNVQQFLERGSEGGGFDAPSLGSYMGQLVSWVDNPIGIYNAGIGLGYTAGPNNGVDIVKLSANSNSGAPSVTITITVGTGRPPAPQPPAPTPSASPTPTPTPTLTPSASPTPTPTPTLTPTPTRTPSAAPGAVVVPSAGSLTGAQMPAVTPEQLALFTASDVAALAPTVVVVMTPAQIAALPPTAFAGFTAAQTAQLSADQVRSVPAAAIAELTPAALRAMLPSALRAFSADQGAALSAEQSRVMPARSLVALSADAMQAMSRWAVRAILVRAFARLSPAAATKLMNNLGSDLSAAQLRALRFVVRG